MPSPEERRREAVRAQLFLWERERGRIESIQLQERGPSPERMDGLRADLDECEARIAELRKEIGST